MFKNLVTDEQLQAVMESIKRRAEAAEITGDEVVLDTMESLTLDLWAARQRERELSEEIAKLQRLASGGVP